MNNQHYNKLPPAAAERLAILAEELGECMQAVGKILRHGYAGHHPDHPEVNNRDDLSREAADVIKAIAMLIAAGDLPSSTFRTNWRFHHKYLRHEQPVSLDLLPIIESRGDGWAV
jgi:NTP pyrophosphatase (non-canonical NTP hydrolase)